MAKQGVYARLEVPVLKRHIKDGVCGSHTECALALAVKEALPEASDVSVGSTISFDLNGQALSFNPTSKVKKFIRDFDNTNDDAEKKQKLKPLGKLSLETQIGF